MRRISIALAVAILAAMLAQEDPAAAAVKPSVVIFMTDDQRWDKITNEYMPNVYSRIVSAPGSTSFANAFVPNPQCCPSRTTTLTGLYSDTTGVWSNAGQFGGWAAFHDSGYERTTMARDFRANGYRTAMIGKYLNGYMSGRQTYVPPGWNRWFALSTGDYYDYGVTSATNGSVQLLHYGSRPRDYATRVIASQAVDFVERSVANGKPFFLYFATTAPHGPAIPDPRDVGRFDGTTGSEFHDRQLASAYSADRGIGRIMNVLPANTIIVFMSDNGYLWGESKGAWGSVQGKRWPYNESIRVPIVVNRPTVAARTDLVLNVDIRASLEAAAHVPSSFQTEGLSWFDPNYRSRTAFRLENYTGGDAEGKVPTYCGEREADFMYVRYQYPDGSYHEELYARANADETTNVVDDPAYATDLARLRSEAHAECEPTPPDYSW